MQVRILQVGVREIGTCQVDPAQVRALQVGPGQVDALEVRALQVRALQVGRGQGCVTHERVGQVDVLEVGVRPFGAREVRALEILPVLVREHRLAGGRVERQRSGRAAREVEHPGEVERDALGRVGGRKRVVERARDAGEVPVVLDEVRDRGLVALVRVDVVLPGARRDEDEREPRAEAAATLLACEWRPAAACVRSGAAVRGRARRVHDRAVHVVVVAVRVVVGDEDRGAAPVGQRLDLVHLVDEPGLLVDRVGARRMAALELRRLQVGDGREVGRRQRAVVDRRDEVVERRDVVLVVGGVEVARRRRVGTDDAQRGRRQVVRIRGRGVEVEGLPVLDVVGVREPRVGPGQAGAADGRADVMGRVARDRRMAGERPCGRR